MSSSLLAKENTQTVKAPRSSNLELFRIITMLLIVAHHYVVNSGLCGASATAPINADFTSWRSIFLMLFGLWGKTGINCFVLITGYFMCKSNITLKKFAKLLLEIYFYRLLIYFIFLATKQEAFSVKIFIKQLLPITTIADDFTDSFIVFYLFIPFLNILIKNLSENQHKLLLLLSISVYVLFATVPIVTVNFNYVGWFCILYFISSYVRLYPDSYTENKKLWGAGLAISFILGCASIVGCAVLQTILGMPKEIFLATWFVSDSNKFFAVLVAFCAFMFFKNLNIKYSPFINAVGSTTFGVLLIHAHSDTMRRLLWVKTLKNVEAYYSPYLVVHTVLSVVCVFAVCSAIDYCRIRFIEKPFFDKKWDFIEQKLCGVYRKIADIKLLK